MLSPLRRRCFSAAAKATSRPSVAVVLSGCGVYDGSEATEVTAVLVHLSRLGADARAYAPDAAQLHVVDHTCGAPAEGEARNALAEAARLTRGLIEPLTALDAFDHDALVVPGGFGAAKNLSDFATAGEAMEVEAETERVLKAFHASKKPIGLCCIAPVLAAKALPAGVELTVGSSDEDSAAWPYSGTAKVMEALGAKHVETDGEAHYDEAHNVVTSAAYMKEAPPHWVHDSVGHMVKKVVEMIPMKAASIKVGR